MRTVRTGAVWALHFFWRRRLLATGCCCCAGTAPAGSPPSAGSPSSVVLACTSRGRALPFVKVGLLQV